MIAHHTTGTTTRILLSEGSSLTSRETVTALGLAGHHVELMTSNPMCLARFSRFVTKVHVAPASGVDPDGYLAAVLRVVKERSINVLIPVQEQAYLFAAARSALPRTLAIALADFTAFEQVQNKATFSVLLTRLGIPQPKTEIVDTAAALCRTRPFPFFVKAPFGTASEAVWRIGDMRDIDALVPVLERQALWSGGLLVQAATSGPLVRAQAVFDRGRLVASHAYRQVVAGPGGGDVIKCSIRHRELRAYVETIGEALRWHGALSFDAILDEASGAPHFIDANPRIVEPMSAWLSGVDLPGALLRVSCAVDARTEPESREGVQTSLGLMALLAAAMRRGRRRDVLAEVYALVARRTRYAATREELVPLRTDPYCIVPLATVLASLMIQPASAARFPKRTVAAYSLSPTAIARIRTWDHARP